MTSRNAYPIAPDKGGRFIRYHVGIDVGKNKHHACVYDIVEDRYTKYKGIPLHCGPTGF